MWQPLSVTPRSPREMREWLQDFRGLVEKASAILKRSGQCEALEADVDGARSVLDGCLQPISEPSAGRSKRWRTESSGFASGGRPGRVRSPVRGACSRRIASKGSSIRPGPACRPSRRIMRRWQREWERAVKPLGLGAAPPGRGQRRDGGAQKLFDKLREAEVLQQRIDGIDRDAEAFTRKVRALAGAVAADLTGRPADEVALDLQRRLTDARQRQSSGRRFRNRSSRPRPKCSRPRSPWSRSSRSSKACAWRPGAGSATSCPRPSGGRLQRRQLEARLRQEDDRLLHLGGGAAVEDFIRGIGGRPRRHRRRHRAVERGDRPAHRREVGSGPDGSAANAPSSAAWTAGTTRA